MMNSFEQDLSIDTPENVYFNYKVAGIGSRFLAAMLDTFIIFLIEIALGFFLVLPLSILLEGSFERLSAWIVAILALLIFAIFWVYYIFFESIWNGQTPGKRKVGLRVIRTNGMPIRFTDSVIRNLVRTIDFLPMNYAAGVITMFVNDQSRRLGDLAAGTLVVYDTPKVTMPDMILSREVAEEPSLETKLHEWPTNKLTQNDFRMLEDYFIRRDELVNRAELAEHILERLLKRMELPVQLAQQDAPEDRLKEIARAAKLTFR